MFSGLIAHAGQRVHAHRYQGTPDMWSQRIRDTSRASPTQTEPIRVVLMQCSDLVMVGKKTLNIGIFFGCDGCRCNAGISIEKGLNECGKAYFLGGDRTDRRDWIDDQPTDRVHPPIER